jgi:hypothetical protein
MSTECDRELLNTLKTERGRERGKEKYGGRWSEREEIVSGFEGSQAVLIRPSGKGTFETGQSVGKCRR